MAMIPFAAMAAYQTGVLLASNNLSDLASASTARSNLGLGSIATQLSSNVTVTGGTINGTTIGGSSPAAGTFLSVTAGNINSGTQCVHASSGGALTGVGADCAVAVSTASLTGSSPFSLSSTNMVTSISNMGTPAAATYNLPAPAAGFRGCLKDGSTNFATNNATVKSPTGNIDGTSGSTGIIMNQTHQELCFVSDGTNYYVE